jgi:catalase
MAKRPTLTTDSGRPVPDNQNRITAGPRGPVSMFWWTGSAAAASPKA